jgi:hypothetical protein
MTWQDRFNRLLKAMTEGEPHKKRSRENDADPRTLRSDAGDAAIHNQRPDLAEED